LPVAAVVDSGPLFAAIDASDNDHHQSMAVLRTPGLRLYVPSMVVGEVSYLAQTRLGPEVEARFLQGMSAYDVVSPETEDWLRIAALVREYGDFPLGGTDASVIVLAERLKTDLVITLDRRHFGAVKPTHCESLRLLPE